MLLAKKRAAVLDWRGVSSRPKLTGTVSTASVFAWRRALKHKFTVGETVYYTASNVARPAASGTYEVIRLLPTDGDDCQYRIKNSTEAFERVAKESQLDFSWKIAPMTVERFLFRSPSKGPVRGNILRKLNAEESTFSVRWMRLCCVEGIPRMNWAWASSPDQTVSMWLTLAVAGFFGIVVLITLLRA
jgi:hypothetical protein